MFVFSGELDIPALLAFHISVGSLLCEKKHCCDGCQTVLSSRIHSKFSCFVQSFVQSCKIDSKSQFQSALVLLLNKKQNKTKQDTIK